MESAIELSNIQGLLQTFVEDADFSSPLPNYVNIYHLEASIN